MSLTDKIGRAERTVPAKDHVQVASKAAAKVRARIRHRKVAKKPDGAKKVANSSRRIAKPSAEFLRLWTKAPLRPIHDDAELKAASAAVESLLCQKVRSKVAEDYLDVLGDIIEKYENEHHPIAAVPDNEMLTYLLGENGMNQSELARKSGISRSTISEIAAGTRKLTRKQIGILCDIFDITPDTFATPEA